MILLLQFLTITPISIILNMAWLIKGAKLSAKSTQGIWLYLYTTNLAPKLFLFTLYAYLSFRLFRYFKPIYHFLNPLIAQVNKFFINTLITSFWSSVGIVEHHFQKCSIYTLQIISPRKFAQSTTLDARLNQFLASSFDYKPSYLYI